MWCKGEGSTGVLRGKKSREVEYTHANVTYALKKEPRGKLWSQFEQVSPIMHLCKEDALASERFCDLGGGEHLKLAMDVKIRQIQTMKQGKAHDFDR